MRRCALLAILVLGLSGSLPAQADTCTEPLAADLALGPGAATLTIHLDLRGCVDPAQVGYIQLDGTLSRSDPFGAKATFEETLCNPTGVCDITVTVPRPAIEVAASYTGDISYKSLGPGPELIAGAEEIRANCELAAPGIAGVCV